MKFLIDLLGSLRTGKAQMMDRIYKLEMQAQADASFIVELQLENRGYLQAVAMAQGETKVWREKSDQLAADLAAAIANASTDGPKADLKKGDDAQAARAMSRNTKQAFVAYQAAVKIMLDRLDTVGKSNAITKEDIRRLRELRVDLGNQLGRSL